MFSNGQQVKKERKREVHKIEYFKNEKNISDKKKAFFMLPFGKIHQN